jgi:glycosyltransferase involved in cell wall biosynthesis
VRRHKILILSFSDQRRDPRVNRQLDALKDEYDVVTAGVCPEFSLSKHHIEIRLVRLSRAEVIKRYILLKMGRFEKVYWETPHVVDGYKKCCSEKYDLIIANDIKTLPLSIKLANKGGIVYLDAHEYEPRHFEDRFMFNYFFAKYWVYICSKYLPSVTYLTSVSEGIAREYEKVFGVKCDIVLNTPDFEELKPNIVERDKIKIIHHGGLSKSRKLDKMIELMDSLDDRYVMDLMFVNNNNKYLQYLKKKAQSSEKIRIIDPVPMRNICSTINTYDIGLFMLPQETFNYRMSLPNKLFEFIQARLAVAIWPSHEMKKIVNKEGVGIISKGFDVHSMANALNGLSSEDIYKYKKASNDAAKIYNATVEKKKIKSIVKDLL